MFQDRNNLIIITLVVLLVLFINMNNHTDESFSNTAKIPVDLEKSNFINFCQDIDYDENSKVMTANCLTRDGSGHTPQTYSFMEPCKILNFNKNRQEFQCLSQS